MNFLDNLFGKKETVSKIDEIINNLKDNNNESKYTSLIDYVYKKKYLDDFYLLTEEEQYKLIMDMAKNIDQIGDQFHIDDIVNMFNVAITSNDPEEKSTFFKLVNKYHLNPQLFRDITDIFHIFQNKVIVLVIYNDLLKMNNNTKYIFDYIKEAKQYNYDEGAFSISIKNLIDKISSIPEIDEDMIKSIIKKQIRSDMHLISAYDIDEDKLLSMEKRYDHICNDINGMETEISNVKKDINDISIKSVTVSEQAAKAIQDTVNRETKDFNDKVTSCNQKVLQARDELASFLETAKGEINDAGLFWRNEINSVVPEDKQIAKKIPFINVKGTSEQTRPTDNLILTMDNYDKFLTRKNSNELYHESFMDLYEHALNKEATMLIGPHGSGKTHSVNQLSKILNLRVYNFGFVADEYSVIKGYMDANGNYVKPLFYEVFKYGGIALFDEVDASESKALIELNKIINGPGEYAPYSFPNGETVEPHPNFLVVTSANTWGDGSSRVYTSREKLDPATLDRLEPIVYNYDQKLESNILIDYPEIYKFILDYRQALEKTDVPMDISTRGVQAVKNFLDRKVSFDKILEKRFIKNTNVDYLNQIIGHMENTDTKEYNEFKEKVKRLK